MATKTVRKRAPKRAVSKPAGCETCQEKMITSNEAVVRANETTLTFPTLAVGSCLLQNARITVRSDGTASWSADASSSSSSNALGVKLFFKDQNRLVIVEWPYFYSPGLFSRPRPWKNNNLAIPQAHFAFIKHASLLARC